MESIQIHDKFSGLKEFTSIIPHQFDHLGVIIKDNRNVIKKVTTDEGTFVIKCFKGMYFFNRLAYSLFRKSKAARSYIYSGILNERGIDTPPHVSWIDCYSRGLLTASYFVSVYYPYRTLKEFIEEEDESKKKSLFHHLAAFAKKLHSLEIYHRDFSVGNILVIPKDDGYTFAMVDLNRIKFRRVSYKQGLQNFTTLKISSDDMNLLISEYALLSNQSPKAFIDLFWINQKRSSLLRIIRKRIRSYTLTPFENMLAGK